MRFIKKLQNFIKIAVQIWQTARPTQLAAALAYYGMMSLPPLLLVMFTLGWFLAGEFILARRASTAAGWVVGPEVEALLSDAILSAVPTQLGGSWFWTVVGILLLLLAASGLFLELQMALNRIWETPPSRHGGVASFILRRFTAIIMLIGLGVVLIVPTTLEYELSTIGPDIDQVFPVTYVEETTIYLLLALSLAVIYKRIPNLPIAWRDVLLAALIVAGLVLLGFWVVATVMSSVSINTPIEVFSLLTLILVSVNYLSLIVILGAVFCRCFALVFGSMKGEDLLIDA